ncbi:glycosyltransferase [Robinsoniella peoriensis]
MMNILIINTRFDGGGAERVTRQLYKGLEGKKISVHVMVGKEYNPEKEYVGIYNRMWKWAISLFYNKITNNTRVVDLYSRRKILNYIKKEKIDILHFNNIHGNYIGIKDIKYLSKYCKIVWTLHDMWAMTGHCACPYKCSNWLSDNCKSCNYLLYYPMIRKDKTEKYLKIKNDCFTGNGIEYVLPSYWLKHQFDNSILKNERVRVINNGVSLQEFKILDKNRIRNKLKIDQDKKIIFFYASDNPIKGLEIIVKALEKLKNKQNYYLITAGGEKEISIKGFNYYKHFGIITNSDLMNMLYAAADVFILPSLYENFPCSILEAFSSGTPVIASNVGGVAEEIDRETGWLFEVENVEELNNKILDAFSNMNRLRQMSLACRNVVEEKFSEEIMIEKYVSLYNDILFER